jgi:transposase
LGAVQRQGLPGRDWEWWASFVVKLPTEPLSRTGRTIGIDRGVIETTTTTAPNFDISHAGTLNARLPVWPTTSAR